jgi:hypothetical protein
MRTSRRVDPVPLVAVALALVATGLYLWLVDQKGDGRFEPAWWFVGLALLGAVEAAIGALLPAPRQWVVLASAAVTLLASAVLSLQTMQTSYGWALFGSVGLPLLGAGAVCAVGAWWPGRRLLLPAGLAAVLLAVALPAARYLATHGEGIG